MELNRRAEQGERGTSMLEMMLVLPVLVLMVFGMIEFSVLLSRWSMLPSVSIDLTAGSVMRNEG